VKSYHNLLDRKKNGKCVLPADKKTSDLLAEQAEEARKMAAGDTEQNDYGQGGGPAGMPRGTAPDLKKRVPTLIEANKTLSQLAKEIKKPTPTLEDIEKKDLKAINKKDFDEETMKYIKYIIVNSQKPAKEKLQIVLANFT
jgi:hypothetical protein